MVMPIGRYMAWVGTALLALLFITNWFLPQSLAQPAAQKIDRPVIRIASIQQPPERIVIDTNLPTIVPPATPSADAATGEPPKQIQSHPSATFRNPVADAEKREPKAKKKQINEVAAKAQRAVPTMLVARSGTATNAPPNRLSFANIISGRLVRDLFNLE
jgi:hypothetical protein